jgi:hypothetical protein
MKVSQFATETSKGIIAIAVFVVLLLTADIAAAQEGITLKDTTPKKRLRSQASIKGFIGGESHGSYVIRIRKGQTLTVQISWRPEGDNRAEFTVSRSTSFFSGDPVDFGTKSNYGKRWKGIVPINGDYYIYVVAHPTAHYTLRVTVK